MPWVTSPKSRYNGTEDREKEEALVYLPEECCARPTGEIGRELEFLNMVSFQAAALFAKMKAGLKYWEVFCEVFEDLSLERFLGNIFCI